jgi:uncharacterized protein YciI
MAHATAFTDPALSELSSAELLARIALARLYLVETTPVRPAVPLPEMVVHARLAYQCELEQQGLLFAAGPIEPAASPSPASLMIIAASTEAEAERIASLDPAVSAGLAQHHVRVHTMNEGVACYLGRALSRRAESIGATFTPGHLAERASTADLRARAVGVDLFLLALDPTELSRPGTDHQTGDRHFVWLRTHEMAARLLSCGPVRTSQPLPPGIWGGGLGVFAASRERAAAIATAEPSRVAGYRTITIRSWRIEYGLAAPVAEALARLDSLPAA